MTPQDWMTFIITTAVILITPGPTNTLHATACAIGGLRQLPMLIVAELCAYGLSIGLLLTLAGPVVASHPDLAAGLKFLAAGLLVWVALKLGRRSTRAASGEGRAIGPGALFLTTLINPKGMIFAFAVFPPPAVVLDHPGVITAFIVIAVIAASAWGSSGRLLALMAGERLIARIAAPALLVMAAWVAFSAGRSLLGA